MTTNSNFDSWNGWMMPGSGRYMVFDSEEYWMDENGDIWVPCFGCATGVNTHIMEGDNPGGG